MTKEQSLDYRRGRVVGGIGPENQLPIGEVIEIISRGGRVFRNSTGGQVGVRLPKTENNDSQLTTEKAKSP